MRGGIPALCKFMQSSPGQNFFPEKPSSDPFVEMLAPESPAKYATLLWLAT
jgi:hypothetical protein